MTEFLHKCLLFLIAFDNLVLYVCVCVCVCVCVIIPSAISRMWHKINF